MDVNVYESQQLQLPNVASLYVGSYCRYNDSKDTALGQYPS